MDFTIKTYKQLLYSLQGQGYVFQTFEDFLLKPKKKSIVLRHDVDLLPYNSLAFAKIQAEQNIKGSYFFRAVPESWDEQVIKEIAGLGHEIGYHYESLTTCHGDMEKALDDFKDNLKKLRELAPVKTICMHGSPRSKYDSKDLWTTNDYHDFDIIGEPYFDVDFNYVLYLTDTGRMWAGEKYSIRDKVDSSFKELSFHKTTEIIEAANTGLLPDKIMFTFHPQRWNDKSLPWLKEFVMQNMKNQVKKFLVKKQPAFTKANMNKRKGNKCDFAKISVPKLKMITFAAYVHF